MLTAWMEPFRDMGCTAVSNQSVGSTDHVSFDRVGLPGFQFIQDRIPARPATPTWISWKRSSPRT